MPTPLMPGVEFIDARGLSARFVRTTAADGCMEIEWTVPVEKRLAAIPHFHPDGPEDWRAVSGLARHRLGRASHVVSAPNGWTVPGGTRHVHPANHGEETLVVPPTIPPAPTPGGEALVVPKIIQPAPPMPELTPGSSATSRRSSHWPSAAGRPLRPHQGSTPGHADDLGEPRARQLPGVPPDSAAAAAVQGWRELGTASRARRL